MCLQRLAIIRCHEEVIALELALEKLTPMPRTSVDTRYIGLLEAYLGDLNEERWFLYQRMTNL